MYCCRSNLSASLSSSLAFTFCSRTHRLFRIMTIFWKNVSSGTSFDWSEIFAADTAASTVWEIVIESVKHRRSVNALNLGLALDETGAKRIVDSRRERIQFQSYEDDHHFASAHQHSSTQESGEREPGQRPQNTQK